MDWCLKIRDSWHSWKLRVNSSVKVLFTACEWERLERNGLEGWCGTHSMIVYRERS